MRSTFRCASPSAESWRPRRGERRDRAVERPRAIAGRMAAGLTDGQIGCPPATPENQGGSLVDERDRERLFLAMKIHFRPLPKNGRFWDDRIQRRRRAAENNDAE